MALANILTPNNYNIFCKSISTTDSPSITGKLSVTNNTIFGAGNISVNQTNTSALENDIRFLNNGVPYLFVGTNPLTNGSYITSINSLNLTAGSTNLVLPAAGLTNDPTSTNILCFTGSTLRINNTVGISTNGTFTATFSGPFPNLVSTISYAKVGRMVTLNFDEIQFGGGGGTNNTAISCPINTIPTNVIPNFLTNTTFNYPIKITNGGVSVNPGQLVLLTTGAIFINSSLNNGTFLNAGIRGSFAITISYQSLL